MDCLVHDSCYIFTTTLNTISTIDMLDLPPIPGNAMLKWTTMFCREEIILSAWAKPDFRPFKTSVVASGDY